MISDHSEDSRGTFIQTIVHTHAWHVYMYMYQGRFLNIFRICRYLRHLAVNKILFLTLLKFSNLRQLSGTLKATFTMLFLKILGSP